MTIHSVENVATSQWYHSLNFQWISYITVIQFLKQVTTKSCRSMQLLGSSLKFHDAVTPVCSMYAVSLKSKLPHKTVLFTFHCLVIKR